MKYRPGSERVSRLPGIAAAKTLTTVSKTMEWVVTRRFAGAKRRRLVESPVPADLELFASLGFTGPDGIAFGKSGKLYVAEALSSTIKVLDPDGSVDAVYAGPALNPPGAPVPWANPANIAFYNKRRSLLVTNHANLVPFDPSLFLVFDVFVDDKGSPLP